MLDLKYDDIGQNPYVLKGWLRFLDYNKSLTTPERYETYERALSHLPRSYKLWKAYLNERVVEIEYPILPGNEFVEETLQLYEKCLRKLGKMPMIWVDYLQLLVKTNRLTQIRRTFDRALQALPVTQHDRIWPLYSQWGKEINIPETCVRIYKRYMLFESSIKEEFVHYLIEIQQYDEAAKLLIELLNQSNQSNQSSTDTASNHKIMLELCELCCTHGAEISKSIDVETILRSGIKLFSDEIGRFWCKLADYFLKQGFIEKSLDIYEEAIDSVLTVRDFTIVFESYVKVTELIITESMSSGTMSDSYIDMLLAKLEMLVDKRPIFLNSIFLRRNPHNVFEWSKRAKLYQTAKDEKMMLLTYIEGLKTIEPMQAHGKFSQLWIELAQFYQQKGDVENSRQVLLKGCQVVYKTVEELAHMWCYYLEFELKLNQIGTVRHHLQQLLAPPSKSTIKKRLQQGATQAGEAEENAEKDNYRSTDMLYKNLRLWNLYLDIEESVGTHETCCAAYERVLEMKIITISMLLNYVNYLRTSHHYEDSYKVYQRGVELFHFPEVKVIWQHYIDDFMKRYGGAKMERLRDIFEQVLAACPASEAGIFILSYANAEEKYGFVRNAIAVYDRGLKLVSVKEKLALYQLFIKKVEIHFGVIKTRTIYERAILDLSDEESKVISLQYADMERKLCEYERARCILRHGSQLVDPKRDPTYWEYWKQFEEAHGNEDTFRDMLRIKRSVEIAFSQVTYYDKSVLQAFVKSEGNNSLNNKRKLDEIVA